MKKITKDRAMAIACAIGVALVLLVLILLPGSDYVIWITAPALAALYFATAIMIKKRGIHSYNKGTVTLILLVTAALYITLYYTGGLFFGFAAIGGGVNLPSIIKYALPIGLALFFGELIREILVNAPHKIAVLLSYLIGVLIDLAVYGGIFNIKSAFSFADFLGMTLFPALAANVLFTYLSKKFGKAPPLCYRLIMALHTYFIPLVPNIPRALPAFILLILPFAILIFIKSLYDKAPRAARKKSGALGGIAAGISVCLMLSFVLLISCKFRYGLLIIASESMTGEIDRGDAIIYEEYEKSREIKENDIIVFSYNGQRTVHRVEKIVTENGVRQYITKGDANEGTDPGYRTDADIVGLVHLKISYIGYPSLWLTEAFNKNQQRGGA